MNDNEDSRSPRGDEEIENEKQIGSKSPSKTMHLSIDPTAESTQEVEMMEQPGSARSNDSIDYHNEFNNRSKKLESLGNLYSATQERIQRSLDLIN